jgi:hypothetical protein
VVWRVEEGRGFVRKKATDIVWTLLCLGLLLMTLVLVFLGGSLAGDVFGRSASATRRHDLELQPLAARALLDDAPLRNRLLPGAQRRGPALPLITSGRYSVS